MPGQDEARRYLRAINQGTGEAQAAELLGILEKQLVKPTADVGFNKVSITEGEAARRERADRDARMVL